MHILYSFRNDVVAVNVIVQDWKKRGDNSPIRYYKTVEEVNENTSEGESSPFSKKDFLLVFQTPAQAQMMKGNPRTLAVDATYNITGYDYKLLTIMVVDKNGKGQSVMTMWYEHMVCSYYICNTNFQMWYEFHNDTWLFHWFIQIGLCGAWAISSRENSFVWNLFVESLRPEAKNINPEVFMSDDDNAAWNGIRLKTFTSLKHKLLCWWHIDQNVQKHCHGSKCKVQVSC